MEGNKATIYVNGVIGEDTILLDVIRQYKSFNNPSSVEVIIDSVGGCVDTGMSIFNYLRNLQLPITTIAKKAYSIAASIFLSGDIRLVESGQERVMIHFPWAEAAGTADHFENVAKELKSLEKDFAEFYSKYTSIDANSITELLKNETYLSANEALEIGIATGIKQTLQAVAIYNNVNKEEKEKMSKTKKFLKALSEFFADASELNINALVLQDANGNEIDFPEVEEGAEPQVGDKAVDSEGKAIEGEVVMPDGSTFIFETGELKEIKPVEEEVEAEESVEDNSEEVEALAEETVEDEIDIEALVAQIENSIFNKIKTENDELKADINALKKLVGSEEATVSARNQVTNTNNKKSQNYLRG
ncbi:ATP-dependent Clp protease proteolytic subunit [Corallibacter sp.]|uniref:ATP-dependent Clp protease proteolytic subunit n=1 Tax=Corallibacter sp. TaxID=2038084 RepID=UPI003AB7FCEF